MHTFSKKRSKPFYFLTIIYQNSWLFRTIPIDIFFSAIKPNHPRAYGNKLYYEQHVVEDSGVHRKGDDGEHESAEAEFTVSERKLIENADSEQAIYKKLCRGELVKTIP